MANIGDTASRSTNTIYYDALLSTTLMAYEKTLTDNIFKEHAFLSYMKNVVDGVEFQDGGERIAVPLMYGDNSTIKTVGGYEVLDTTPQEGITTAFYPWAEIGGTVSLSRLDIRKNSGEGRLINLLKAKIKQAEMTMQEKLNNDLIGGTANTNTFVPETSVGGSLGLLPLHYFFRKLNATDPLVGGTPGNIASASYSWWRHHTASADGSADSGYSFDITASTWQHVANGLRTMYNYCSRGTGGPPDLCVMDQATYESYEHTMDAKIRYTNTTMADMGFDTIKCKGATCIWDEMVPDLDNGYVGDSSSWDDGNATFINTNFYKIFIDSETNVVTTPFVEPENQTVKTSKILFMGNAGVSNMRKHGVLYAISDALTA